MRRAYSKQIGRLIPNEFTNEVTDEGGGESAWSILGIPAGPRVRPLDEPRPGGTRVGGVGLPLLSGLLPA
jgi:hypothetical protein